MVGQGALSSVDTWGETPTLGSMVISALASTSSLTMAAYPYSEAQISAVVPPYGTRERNEAAD
jgi:hypothetical protein